MSVKSWSDGLSTTVYVNIADTQTVICDPNNGSSVTWTPPAVSIAANDAYWSGTKSYTLGRCFIGLSPSEGNQMFSNPTNYVGKGAYSNAVGWTSNKTYAITSLFNSTNPTSKTVTTTFYVPDYDGYVNAHSADFDQNIYPENNVTLTTVYFTLNAPPSATVSSLSYDTPYVYTGLTTASVSVSNLTAQYSGTVTDVTLTIGSQTASRSTAGTLSILLSNIGTFTPTVTVTDSRGQYKTYTLDPITVNGYTAPTVTFTAERTLSTGVPDDEGTYAVLDATFKFTDVVASLQAPSVVMTDETGTQTTPVVTWYSSRAADGTLSGSVTWSSLSYGDTVYGRVPNLNTQYSYQISVRPRDSEGTGTAITQTVGSAFYTVDFLAGGHGIAFGKPASAVGFECAMDATFDETLTAQDMTQQEVSDFVDSLQVGGGNVAVDLVVEEGISGIWTYRKWSSGIAECWGMRAVSLNINQGFGALYYTTFNQDLPSGLFTAIDSVNATRGGLNGSGNGLCWISFHSVSTSQLGAYVIDSVSASQTWTFSFSVKGRWK